MSQWSAFYPLTWIINDNRWTLDTQATAELMRKDQATALWKPYTPIHSYKRGIWASKIDRVGIEPNWEGSCSMNLMGQWDNRLLYTQIMSAQASEEIKWPPDDEKNMVRPSVRPCVTTACYTIVGWRLHVTRGLKEKKNKGGGHDPFGLSPHIHTLIPPYWISRYQLTASVGNEGDLFVIGVFILIIPTKIHMANHSENHTRNTPNGLSSAQEGSQFSFFSPTAPLN